MELLNILITILLLYLFPHSQNCLQVYLNNTVYDCSSDPSVSKGYLCNGLQNSCTSFLLYRSKSPYDNPVIIAYLLGSETSDITSINNISATHNIPSNKNDTYWALVKETFQGLTTCQAIMGQNYYPPTDIAIDAELKVPMLCACPTANQTAKGVTSLLVYSVISGDTIKSIGEAYGVDEQSILEANKLSVPQSANSSMSLLDFTPILVPLIGNNCKENPNEFYCKCYREPQTDGSSKGLLCDESGDKEFPTRLVAALEKLSFYGNGEMAKLFKAEELQKATDNYNKSRFLGQGGFGTVYKGMLPDGTIVAVKKSKEIERNQIETFVNEVVILSQINHRNIVKLFGYCLETETPLLVYEFIPNGTLSHRIHRRDNEPSLSWETRLRIACEDNKVYEILDGRVVKEARKDDMLVIANLAMKCLRLNGKKRPTMKERWLKMAGSKSGDREGSNAKA
ncbi:hypothetical protein ACSQ67_022896 [Phaseolus vulgaris]